MNLSNNFQLLEHPHDGAAHLSGAMLPPANPSVYSAGTPRVAQPTMPMAAPKDDTELVEAARVLHHGPIDRSAVAQVAQHTQHQFPMNPSFPSVQDLGPDYRHEPGTLLGHGLLRNENGIANGMNGLVDGSNAIVNHQFPSVLYSGQPSEASPGHTQATDYYWGSDANFNGSQGFVPQSVRDTTEALSAQQLQMMQCLSYNQSAGTTRPSSPVVNHGSSSSPLATASLAAMDIGEGPPRKRRKSKIAKEEAAAAGDEDESSPRPTTAKSGRRRKTKTEAAGAGSSPGEGSEATPKGTTPPKRRKSATNGAKPPRENLTEEQKRENHIRSEQKRRTVIKEGFDDLCAIVPKLRGGGISKSNMLTTAAEWLDELLRYNKELTDQLARIRT